MSGTADKAKGAANEFTGAVKQNIGKAIGSDRLEGEGAAQELKGKMQKAVGNAKNAVKDAANKVAEQANRKL